MARRGRPPKPTNLKVLEGNRGKRPLPKDEPKPKPLAPERPKWLTGEAKKMWAKMVPELERLGLLTVIDGQAFAAACQSWATYVECQRFLKRKDNGLTFVTPNGYVQQRPEVAIGQKALADFRAFCTEFGLTPASRVKLGAKPAAEDTDPMEALLNRTGG